MRHVACRRRFGSFTLPTTRYCWRPLLAEDGIHTECEDQIQRVDHRHHDDHEDQHDAGITEEFFAGRGDDLLQFIDYLPEEEDDFAQRPAACTTVLFGIRDDVLTRLVDYISRHLVTTFRKLPTRACARFELQGGQDLNLQPAVLETAALPIEPPPFAVQLSSSARFTPRVSPEMGIRNDGRFQLPRSSVGDGSARCKAALWGRGPRCGPRRSPRCGRRRGPRCDAGGSVRPCRDRVDRPLGPGIGTTHRFTFEAANAALPTASPIRTRGDWREQHPFRAGDDVVLATHRLVAWARRPPVSLSGTRVTIGHPSRRRPAWGSAAPGTCGVNGEKNTLERPLRVHFSPITRPTAA